LLSLVVLSLLLCGSATAQKVKTGYDKSADFSRYKTYTWAKPDRPSSRPFLREHVMGSIDDQLKRKGLQQVEQGGDLLVVASGGIGFDSNMPTGAPILSYPSAPIISMDATMWSGVAVSSPGPLFAEGSLGVDLVDMAADKLVWRGTVSEKLDPEKKNESLERVSKAIEKLFKDYPPKKEK
jgi:hypothetical protein